MTVLSQRAAVSTPLKFDVETRRSYQSRAHTQGNARNSIQSFSTLSLIYPLSNALLTGVINKDTRLRRGARSRGAVAARQRRSVALHRITQLYSSLE